MSRIGRLPIEIPSGVDVKMSNDRVITVNGPRGELTQKVSPEIEVEIADNLVVFKRSGDSKQERSLHGLYRALVNNMIHGVSKGFEVQLELVGVGYRAEQLPNNVISLVLGYSHHTYIQLPPEVKVEVKADKRSNPIITLQSNDKQLLGHVAAKIRSFREPEPYKGKGIKFVGEVLRRKAGKAAAK